ncbi:MULTISPECIES: 50S ribosomal protein L6 [Thermoanaerobacterium]|uniref:Large ribosomal subunit protein uL6 n=1 Tax=Thermoanaerobacterium xylanolyticum (strain ATCC 49914 / DSM 7097 / LX-11) TaxID=858215 RepID=F6BGP8_THEXL|nr:MULTISPECIES: 50S ribosomal protein L6 [Thermoanaerobacterium]AEF16405.1 ribosomal protein L6 [Thermoanaerobacterium xylanolyticum LX-11]MDE4543389.1 50S ribosomal protein L6 [Thermoanaerobacterium sp. R66]ORX22291.1 50S ribosomal protein L6 [Thermoanaerobacterium sp. PSU-2]HHV74425.1 50S ribosomal protein L6 [Thermoanaerobacterium sp.]
MSRIGKQPVEIPKDVTVTVNNNHVVVKGPKGTLERDFPNLVNIAVEDNKVIVTRSSDDKEARAMHGTTRALIQNMVKGVSTGYEKSLEIVGVGYRVAKQGKKIVLTVGYSHPVEIEEEPGIEFVVDGTNKITVKGIDKQRVGEVAANIRKVRQPDAYKGKGIRYVGEYVRLKEGKTGKK